VKLDHVGYLRKSRKGRAVKLDLSLEALLMANRYRGHDGKEYIGLVVNLAKLLELLDNRREVIAVNQLSSG
jgi:hypothetical protein